MAGIYIHIPFCKNACHYCNFHFSTSFKFKDMFLDCLLKEIELQKNFLNNFAEKTNSSKRLIDTLYFGGGTPGVLKTEEIKIIIDSLNQFFDFVPDAEITLEANPEDLSFNKILQLKQSGINRLSIGIQSFQHNDLKYLNRVHSPETAICAINNAFKAGFENISVDLIYGIPDLSNKKWEENLLKLIELQVPHISPYCLTIEPKTPLNVFIKKGKTSGVNEKTANEHFKLMLALLKKYNYLHYEISNFGKPGYLSKHNINYWERGPYLGLGPSAHSFDKTCRYWNISNTEQYIKQITKGKVPFEKENINIKDTYNEYVMLSLRTMWGCSISQIKKFDDKFLTHFNAKSDYYITNGMLVKNNDQVKLSDSGKFFADKIACDLFWD